MKIVKENQFIKCDECGKILGEYKDNWLKIKRHNVIFSSNGVIHKFVCNKCKSVTEITILK